MLFTKARIKDILGKTFLLIILFTLFIFFLYFWERFVVIHNIPKRILPKPSDITDYLYRDFFNTHHAGYQSVLTKTLQSFYDALIGFALSAVLGSLIGMFFARYKLLEIALMPLIFITQLLPLPAFAPIVAAVFGYDIRTKIIIIVIFTIFPVIVNTNKAVKNISTNYISLFKIYNASKIKFLTNLLIPSIIPSLLLNLKIIATASFVASIVSELSLTISSGIGNDIFVSFNNQVIPRVWTSLLIISVISLVFFGFIAMTEKYVLERYHYGKFET